MDETAGGPSVGTWGIAVWVPESTGHVLYLVERGAFRSAPPASLTFPTGGTKPPAVFLMRLDGESVPPLIDSDRAQAIADDAGARAYRQRAGAVRGAMHLKQDGPNHALLVWSSYYSRAGATEQLDVIVDARTGDVIRLKEQ